MISTSSSPLGKQHLEKHKLEFNYNEKNVTMLMLFMSKSKTALIYKTVC